MELDKNIISKISRQWTLTADIRDDNCGYDDIIAMKVDPIPNLENEDYYVQFVDTTGRDIVQQADNIYSTQRPKWDVLPRGTGDIKKAEELERIIEWYMWKAAQMGKTPFHSVALSHACKYNAGAAQIEWVDDYGFCVYIYHRNTVVYEYGAKLHWVAVVTNVPAVSVIEKFNDYAKPGWLEKLTKGDDIGVALKKIQKIIDEDEEARVMFVDYTSDNKRYTYCWKVADETVDDSFGYDDDGGVLADVIVIQDKANSLEYVNWAISEGVGDPLLAPLLKANLYQNINDSETVLRTKAMRIAFAADFLQEGASMESMTFDYSGPETVAKAPPGTRVTPLSAKPLDPAFGELAIRDRNIMTNAVGIGPTASLQVSNVQHSTLQEQIKLRLAQLEPYKRITEKLFVQLAYLMFRYMKKKKKVLKGWRLYGKGGGMQRGQELSIEPDDINLDELYIECRILANNENDKLQITNQISMLKQSGIAIPDSEYVEMLYMGSPDFLREKYEAQEIRRTALETMKAEMMAEVEIKTQQRMAEFQAELMARTQPPPTPPQGQEVATQPGMPLPSDVQGQGVDAGMGGMPPQQMSPEITQGMRGR